LLILRSTRVLVRDFDTLKFLFKTFKKADLRVLTNVSGILSDTIEGKHEKEILEKFRALQANVTFFAWDQRVTGNSEFRDTHFLPEAKQMRERKYFPEETTIGFYGKLSSERGLFRLLLSVYLNPKLKFRIMGYGFNHKYLFRTRKFVSIQRTPLSAAWSLFVNYFAVSALKFKRVNFKQRYFKDEVEMAREFQNCSAVYFSCAHSPYSSGLVYQSLAASVPVVWSDGDSAMAYVLKREFPLGEIRNNEIFRLGGLTNFVSDLKRVKTHPIFENKDFDKVLMNCSCQ
jgi:glycosyltransferase involved in cell wall biosynthesis